MEKSLHDFLRTFNRSSDTDFKDLVSLLQTQLKPKLTNQAEIVKQIQKQVTEPANSQKATQLLKAFQNTKVNKKASILYILLELSKVQVKQQETYFDFSSFQIPKEEPQPLAQNQQSISPNIPSINKLTELVTEKHKTQRKSHETITDTQIHRDLTYLLQGIDGQVLKLEINAQTGLYQAVSSQTIGLSQAALINGITDCGSVFIRLMNLLKSLEQSSSLLKREFVSFAKSTLQKNYFKQLNDLNTLITQESVFSTGFGQLQIYNFVQKYLKPVVIFLALTAESISSLSGMQIVFASKDFQMINTQLYFQLKTHFNAVLKQMTKQFIFETKIDAEFFIQKTVKTDWDEMFTVTFKAEELQQETILDIGRTNFYTQNYFKKFIDFGAYKGYQQLISEFENSEIMLEDMNLTGFHKFTNDFINQHLIKEFSLHQHLHMIKKLYFGFQSDFISQFSALNQGQTQISSKTQCENDLDYLLKQSCFNYDKNILNKIGVEVFKKEFLVTFNPQELSCVISEETALNFQKVFKLIVNLRKLELHLLTEKKIHTKKFNFIQFKLNQLTKVMSNYLQLKLEQVCKNINEIISEQQENLVIQARKAFTMFNEQCKLILFNDIFTGMISNIYQLQQQFINQYYYLEDAGQSDGVKTQQKQLMQALQMDVMKNISQFIKEIKKSNEEDVEALAERLESVGV
ncbi:Spindle_pole body component [Hexamita inflata]|uniref:Spindle pole body component n=1 Tax=Hexamita inflata TaxID=28002 RepID=A0AA86V3D4_9EUKA|nr:Spindle pole body component [Hexamita inflata]